VSNATGAASWLVTLRRLLDARPGALTLDDAAKALALSPRSLQRRLSSECTTFQAEVARSQVRIAERLLGGSSAPLATIALEVGCSTPQRFSSLFRRVTGETPSAFRKRVQAERGERT
jgi:AraC-like DNA-binding protein